jgi:hypothetical protein
VVRAVDQELTRQRHEVRQQWGSGVCCRVQAAGETLPADIACPPSGSVFACYPLIKLHCRRIVQALGILAQVFKEKLATQRLHYLRIPHCRIHLAMAEQGIRMQVARSDRRPPVVDQHDLRVNVDVLPFAGSRSARDSRQREIPVLAKRFQLVKDRPALGTSSPIA